MKKETTLIVTTIWLSTALRYPAAEQKYFDRINKATFMTKILILHFFQSVAYIIDVLDF